MIGLDIVEDLAMVCVRWGRLNGIEDCDGVLYEGHWAEVRGRKERNGIRTTQNKISTWMRSSR